MRELRVGSLLIKKGKSHVGIVTDTDLVRKVLAGSQDISKLTVEKIMSSPVCTIESNQAVDEAQDMMGDLGVRHLAVTKGGSIVGVVSVRDLLMHYKRYASSKLAANQVYSEPKIGQD
jgi:signal-transduction protein with cAMP-binding, CBS, and nucleotidyltransferase domain